MIRDILNAVNSAISTAQPPTGNQPTVTPGPSNTGSGSVSLDASSAVLGTYNCLLVVTTGGAPGTAQGQLSLDNGNNVGNPNSQGNLSAPFVLPAGAPGYPAPLPPITPTNLSPGPSGLVLNFSGTFNVGDTFSFQALPAVTFLCGAEELSSQDSLYPRVIHVPVDDDFRGTEDYAQGQDQRFQQRSLLTDVARFETHCWGIDYDRAEVLRDAVINGIHFALQATKSIVGGGWQRDGMINKVGRLYVLRWSVKKPVLQLQQDTIPAAPPFSLNLSTQVIDQL